MKEKSKVFLKKASIFLIVALILVVIVVIQNRPKVELTQLQANTDRQMMGYILKTKNNKVIVIDGGLQGDAQNLINQIDLLGGKVDAWFLTHPHMDHVQAFMEIVETTDIPIENIYVTLNDLSWYQQYAGDRLPEIEAFFKTIEKEKVKDKIQEVSLNQKICIDEIKCEILGVKNPEITTNPINNSSMVLQMKFDFTTILFLADTGVESGEKLVKTQKEKLSSDIVQMAHHGQSGVTKEVYEQIKPKICLWPTPLWLWNNDPGTGYNTGKWTTIETRQWMEELKVKQHYIEKDGDQTIKL